MGDSVIVVLVDVVVWVSAQPVKVSAPKIPVAVAITALFFQRDGTFFSRLGLSSTYVGKSGDL